MEQKIQIDVYPDNPYGFFLVEEILDSLKKHKKRYVESLDIIRDIYKKRVDIYTKEYSEYVKKQLTDTLGDGDKKPVQPVMPTDRRKTYDKLITFYEHNTLLSVALSGDLFNQYYLDQWDFILETISHLSMLTHAGEGGVEWMSAFDASQVNTALISYSN